MAPQKLNAFNNADFSRGRSRVTEALWMLIGGLVAALPFVPGKVHVALLRAFGAKIGQGVVIKPGVKIKFPWRLSIGDHTWIGERAWIDNLAPVEIGSHVCLSQGSYLCTGSHDWTRESFDLITRPIVLEDGCWVGAMARLAPGVRIGAGAIVALGAVVTRDVPPQEIWQGNPAGFRRARP